MIYRCHGYSGSGLSNGQEISRSLLNLNIHYRPELLGFRTLSIVRILIN
jgi:hypothetical protein